MARLKIFFHDNCFDGATSAALFGKFFSETIAPGIDLAEEVALQGVQHSREDPFAGVDLSAQDNACVDFRYCDDPKMTWWFDHHVSAFQPPELAQHFEADDSGQKFFEPTASSCAKYIDTVLRTQFDYSPEPSSVWGELLHWADLIDSARFTSPQQAVELREPALRIMTWLENNDQPELTHRLIRSFGRVPLAELAAADWIAGPLEPLFAAHRNNIAAITERATYDDGIVFFDLTDAPVGPYNKFISYMLHPDAAYTVALSRLPARIKVSIGANPWRPELRTHNIAHICERYGGGGHPVVGAISVSPDDLPRARKIVAEVRAELATAGDGADA